MKIFAAMKDTYQFILSFTEYVVSDQMLHDTFLKSLHMHKLFREVMQNY